MPTLIINGKEVTVDKGTTVLNAAKKAGIDIPVFCYHDGLSISANCRMCLVEAEMNGRKFRNPVPACHTMASDGMVIETENDKIKDIRKGVLEFLLLNHPIDCPICDKAGECMLQDQYIGYSGEESRLEHPKVHKVKATSIGKHVMLDSERCILCSRCVRFTAEITKTDEMMIFNRSNHAEIGVFPDAPLDNDYSLCVTDICPVGALTSKDFRFKKRTWFLSEAKSICTKCSKGCNISLESDNGELYRVKPLKNLDVNQYWMCDEGRTLTKEINESRLVAPIFNKEELSLKEGLNKLKDLLTTYKKNKVGVIISASNSTENTFAIKHFFKDFLGVESFYMLAKKDGEGDDLLKQVDKNPNRRGVKLALANNYKEMDVDLIVKKHELVIIFGTDLKKCAIAKLNKAKHLVVLGTNKNILTDIAEVSYPVLSFAEETGTFINEDNRMQRFFPMNLSITERPTAKGVMNVVPSRMNLSPTFKVVSKLAKEMGYDLELDNIFDIMKIMKDEIEVLKDFKYKDLGKNGLIIEGL